MTSEFWAHPALQFLLGGILASVVGGAAYVVLRWMCSFQKGTVYLVGALPILIGGIDERSTSFINQVTSLMMIYGVITLLAFVGSFAQRVVAGQGESLFFHLCFVLAAIVASCLLGVLCSQHLPFMPTPVRWQTLGNWSYVGYLLGLLLTPLLLPYFLWALRNSQRRPGFDVPIVAPKDAEL